PRYRHTDGPAMTPNPAGRARPSWVITSSVRPLLRYACAGSPFRSSKGRTAITEGSAGGRNTSHAPTSSPATPASTARTRRRDTRGIDIEAPNSGAAAADNSETAGAGSDETGRSVTFTSGRNRYPRPTTV